MLQRLKNKLVVHRVGEIAHQLVPNKVVVNTSEAIIAIKHIRGHFVYFWLPKHRLSLQLNLDIHLFFDGNELVAWQIEGTSNLLVVRLNWVDLFVLGQIVWSIFVNSFHRVKFGNKERERLQFNLFTVFDGFSHSFKHSRFLKSISINKFLDRFILTFRLAR